MSNEYHFTESQLYELGIEPEPGLAEWLNQCSFDFPEDVAYLGMYLLDDSGSMSEYRNTTREFMRNLVEENYSERASMLISISRFSYETRIYIAPVEPIDGVAKKVVSVTNEYTANGGKTAFYSAVYRTCRYMKAYVRVLQAKFNLEVKGLFMALSDGMDNDSSYSSFGSISNVRREIESLQRAGIDTVFVPFGSAVSSSLGKELGFQRTMPVNKSHQALIECSKSMSRLMNEGSKQLGSASLGAGASAMFSEAISSKAAGMGPSAAIAQNPGAFAGGRARFRRGGKI